MLVGDERVKRMVKLLQPGGTFRRTPVELSYQGRQITPVYDDDNSLVGIAVRPDTVLDYPNEWMKSQSDSWFTIYMRGTGGSRIDPSETFDVEYGDGSTHQYVLAWDYLSDIMIRALSPAMLDTLLNSGYRVQLASYLIQAFLELIDSDIVANRFRPPELVRVTDAYGAEVLSLEQEVERATQQERERQDAEAVARYVEEMRRRQAKTEELKRQAGGPLMLMVGLVALGVALPMVAQMIKEDWDAEREEAANARAVRRGRRQFRERRWREIASAMQRRVAQQAAQQAAQPRQPPSASSRSGTDIRKGDTVMYTDTSGRKVKVVVLDVFNHADGGASYTIRINGNDRETERVRLQTLQEFIAQLGGEAPP